MIRAWVMVLMLFAAPAWALDFNLPVTARLTVERNTAPDTYTAPIGVFQNGTLPSVTIEGNVQRAAWRLNSPGLTPFQVIRPLRAQLIEAGFDIVLDCAADLCGGFDFRFATETLPGPNMYVNIRAFQYVTGIRKSDGEVSEVITLFASTAATSAYVQIIYAGADENLGITVAADADLPRETPRLAQVPVSEALLARGHVVLADLDFASGDTELGPGPHQSLAEIAGFLEAEPTLRIALVGHTDTSGGLDPNIAVSRERARSVRQRLIDRYNVDPRRLDAEGMGYLAPVASNLDTAGREQNRRVEAVLLGAP